MILQERAQTLVLESCYIDFASCDFDVGTIVCALLSDTQASLLVGC